MTVSNHLRKSLYGKAKPREVRKSNGVSLVVAAIFYIIVIMVNYTFTKPPFMKHITRILLPAVFYSIALIIHLSLALAPKPSWSSCNYLDLLNKSNICLVCKIPKLARSQHCYACNTCIEEFDHHNYWIRNCVNKTNRLRYLTFMVMHLIACIKAFLFSLCGLFIQEWKSPFEILNTEYNNLRKAILVCNLLTATAFMFFVLHLVYVHICSLFLNKTCYERFGRYGKLPFERKMIRD